MEKFYEDEYVKFVFQDGILFGTYTVEKIDLKIAKHVIKKRLEHFNSHDYPALADYTKVIETSKEARDYFAAAEATQYFKAIAVLTNSMVGNMIYNFYIILSKPALPVKLFSDKESAIKWLNNFL